MLRRQLVTPRDLGVAGLAAMQGPAFFEEFRTRRAVDRAIDAATAEERSVGRVDDGVDVEPGDVANGDREACAMRLFLKYRARA